MYVWFPLHQTPVTYFGTQIPLPLMKTKTNFLASDLFAYIILTFMVGLVCLCLVEMLTLVEFLLCFLALYVVCAVVLAYFRTFDLS